MEKSNLVLGSFFNSQPDPQKNLFWKADINRLYPLIDSVIEKNQKIIIFHDCFDDTPDIKNCEFIRTSPNPDFVPTVARWEKYLDYLSVNSKRIKNVFCVDSTDVEMLNNPFPFINADMLYCGSEYQWKVGDRWLQKRKKVINISDYDNILNENKNNVMLNAGIVGGHVFLLKDFLEKLTDLHNSNSKKIKKSLDMPIFNYCVMKYFSNKYVTGDIVHTPYRRKITQSSSWWKHK